MIIVITGNPGAGKTKICVKLINIAIKQGYTCGGIITDKSSDNGIIVKDIQTGDTKQLALIDSPTNTLVFNPDGFRFGNNIIERSLATSLIIVDEIGQFESNGQGFSSILTLINSGKIDLAIVVIKKDYLPALTAQLTDALIFNVTTDNNEDVAREIGTILSNYIQSEREIKAHYTVTTRLK